MLCFLPINIFVINTIVFASEVKEENPEYRQPMHKLSMDTTYESYKEEEPQQPENTKLEYIMEWFKEKGILPGNPENIKYKYTEEKKEEIKKPKVIELNNSPLILRRKQSIKSSS